MRSSIKLKFSIFLLLLLLVTLLLLRYFVLTDIRDNQKAQFENYLQQQRDFAESYLLQRFLSSGEVLPGAFLENHAQDLTKELSTFTGQVSQLISLDPDWKIPAKEPLTAANLQEILPYAQEGRTLYQVKGDDLFYLSPLKIQSQPMGILALYYSLRQENAFYQHTANRFLQVGAGIFLLSFVVAYFYFRTYAMAIRKLSRTVGEIEGGRYEFEGFSRKDEIGLLSQGIFRMSQKIKSTLLEVKNEEQKLQIAVEKLQVLGQQQKEFIQSVTHEFKTPLTSMKAYLDLLEMYPEDPLLLKKARSAMEEETRRLYEMVENTLQLTKRESYTPKTAPEPLALHELLHSLHWALQGKLEMEQLTLTEELEDVYVLGDREALLTVLLNLLDNAVKYNKPRGDIRVKCFPEGDMGILLLQDSGIGIPKEQQTRIFEPFYTVDPNRSRETGGVGLGLALAKRYTELQGGTLSLVSSSEEGTLFRLSLPLAKHPEKTAAN